MRVNLGIKNNVEIVVVDDNFAIRHLIRTILHGISQRLRVNFSVHTSEDGVQGLGYIFTARPDIIIIDTTLPKYSGRELLEFLTTNPRYNGTESKIIILHDGSAELTLPPRYTKLDKSNPNILTQLALEINKYLIDQKLTGITLNQKEHHPAVKIALRTANQRDRSFYKLSNKHNKLATPALIAQILLCEIITSLCLSLIKIFSPQLHDSNLTQSKQDEQQFRVKYFPTLVGILMALFLILIQFFLYIVGGVTIFNLAGKNESVTAAYGNGYDYRRTVTIDVTKVSGGSNLTNYPLLVNGTYSYLATTGNGGLVTNASGFDIIFTSDAAGSVKLDHEIEKYVATTGEIVMWVKVPTVSASVNTVIYMFYGNSSISTTQENKTGVWASNNFAGVWHLKETGGTGNVGDSTSNANNGTWGSTQTAADLINGQIDGAQDFDGGTNDMIDIIYNSSLNITNTITIEAWIKRNDTDNAVLIMRENGTPVNYAFTITGNSTTTMNFMYQTFSNTHTYQFNFANDNIWKHVAVTYTYGTAGSIAVYVNGSAVSGSWVTGTGNEAAFNDTSGALRFGVNQGSPLTGQMDEIRISNTIRTAGWITTSYNNQSSPSTFYTLGTQETSSNVTLTVSTSGSQTAAMNGNTTNQYVGGRFVLTPAGGTATITGITIAEQGTIDASVATANVRLRYELDTTAPYDCASETHAGTETQFGSTVVGGFDAPNGNATFTDSVAVTTVQAMCVYVITDFTRSMINSQTFEVQITNPSTQVTMTEGTVSPGTAVAIAGTTTLTYTGTAVTVSSRLTQTASLTANTTNQYVGGAFVIVPSNASATMTSITITEKGTIDGSTAIKNLLIRQELDTTLPNDCASASYGGTETQYGVTSANGFNGPDGSATFTGSLTSTTSRAICIYVVFNVDITALNGQTIEIEISNPNTDVVITNGGVIPETPIAISGTTTVTNTNPVIQTSTTGTQITSVAPGASNTYIGGAFVVSNINGVNSSVTSVMISENGTIDALNNIKNVKLFYELDTSSPYNCASETYAGTETQYGSTAASGFTAASGNATFTATVAITTTQALCLYPVMDIQAGASDGQTIEIQITNPSTAVVASGTAGETPTTVVAIAGTTTVQTVASVTVSTNGSQNSSILIGTTSQYIGGSFAFATNAATTNITSVKITETGTVNAQTILTNVKLFWEVDSTAPVDCASETYAGSETQFGTTGSFGGLSTSTFSGTAAIPASQAVCMYVVMDIGSSAGSTVEIEITNPSTDVTVSSGSVTTATVVAISGTTTLVSPSCGSAFSNGYCYRRAITIDFTKVSGGSNLSDYPLLLNGTYAYLANIGNGGNVTNSSGFDIIFTSDSTGSVQLNHEIEKYVSSTGEIVMWVKVPTVSASVNTTIYMFYYNSAITTSQENKTGVWDSNYRAVWHMKETGGTGNMGDSTSNANNGTWGSAQTAADLITGKINGAQDFDGTSNDVVTMGASSSITITSSITIEGWVKRSATYGIMMMRDFGSDVNYGLRILNNGSDLEFLYGTSANPGQVYTTSGGVLPNDGNWKHVAVTYTYGTASSMKIYVNGVLASGSWTAGTGNFAAPTSTSYGMQFGTGQNNHFTGQLDEFRLSATTRTQGWLVTNYNNHDSPSTFYSVGSQEVPNNSPVVTSVSLNGGSSINLTSNSTVSITTTATVTDADGFANISSASVKTYRSGVAGASSCTTNDNNCYSASCSLGSCSGNSCTATCNVSMQFFSDPTDAGSSFASEYWLSTVTAIDASSNSGSGTSPISVTEVNTLRAVNVTSSIAYGTLLPGNNTGATNQTTTLTNIGNSPIDVEISGTALCTNYPTCTGTTIPVGNQKYSTLTFTYASGGVTLTISPVQVQVSLVKPTQTPSNSSGTIYWGISLPSIIGVGTYTGVNTVTAIPDT